MSASPGSIEFHLVLTCPCGQRLSGTSEDAIVDTAFAHLRDKHPELADGYEREHILAITRRLVRG